MAVFPPLGFVMTTYAGSPLALGTTSRTVPNCSPDIVSTGIPALTLLAAAMRVGPAAALGAVRADGLTVLGVDVLGSLA
jgi:hypothetical protein